MLLLPQKFNAHTPNLEKFKILANMVKANTSNGANVPVGFDGVKRTEQPNGSWTASVNSTTKLYISSATIN